MSLAIASKIPRRRTAAGPGPGTAAGRIAGLDGLRALAVAMVVAYHFAPDALPAGFLGVDLFFALSGYLITRLLLAEVRETGRLRLGRFYARRVRRLAPSVAVLILVVVLADLLVWPGLLPTLRGSVLASLGYAANWYLIARNQSYFEATAQPPMLEHLWSLAVEEQFYLLWPLAIAAVTGAALSMRSRAFRHGPIDGSAPDGGKHGPDLPLRLTGLALLLATASSVLMAVLAISSDVPYSADSSRIYFGSDTHCMGLFAGAAAAAWEYRRRRARPAGRAFGIAADCAAGAALLFVLFASRRWNEYTATIFHTGFAAFAAASALLVLLVARRGSRVARMLEARPLVAVGKRSYAIYLWHWPVSVVTRPGIDVHLPMLADFLLRLAITLVLACASHRWIEVPLRAPRPEADPRTEPRAPGPRRRFAAPPPGLAIGVPVLATCVLLTALPTQTSPNPGIAAAGKARTVADPPQAAGAARGAAAGSGRGGTAAVGAATSSAQSAKTAKTAQSTQTARSGSAPPHYPVSTEPAEAFGDSVMLGAQYGLLRAFPNLTVHATVGILPRPILAEVRTLAEAKDLPELVVIHIGDNGYIVPGDLTDTLELLRDRARVVLVTAKVPREWQDSADQTVRAAAAQFPNVRIADWETAAQGHPEWFVSDGVHPTGAGIDAFTRCIAQAATEP